jgi:hypothetical protein
VAVAQRHIVYVQENRGEKAVGLHPPSNAYVYNLGSNFLFILLVVYEHDRGGLQNTGSAAAVFVLFRNAAYIR